MPTSVLLHDNLIIPITIHNLFREEKMVRFSIIETIISKEKILKKEDVRFMVGGKNQTQYFYDFDTNDKELHEGDQVQISATIAVGDDDEDGQVFDFVTKSTTILVGGFN